MDKRALVAAFAAAGFLTVTPASAASWLDLFSRDRAPAPRQDLPVVTVQAGDAERFNRIESQMRSLTGQVEELQFQVRQLTEQLRSLGVTPQLQGSLAAPPPRSNAPVPLPAAPQNAQSLGTLPQALPAPTQQAGVPVVPAVGGGPAPLDLSSLASNAPQPQLQAPVTGGAFSPEIGQIASIQPPSGDPGLDYQRGYGLIVSGNYVAAESTFRQFVEAYPGDARAPDARFWIGESHFARGQYREAADEFLAGYKAYPKSPKGPETLLKLGLSLAGLGEREAACSTYAAVLKQYPDASNSLKQRVLSEQAVAAC